MTEVQVIAARASGLPIVEPPLVRSVHERRRQQEIGGRAIARDWNVPASGSGFVTRFQVRRSFIDRYDVKDAGGQSHLEYWIPAKDLHAFNAAIVGTIEVVRSFS